MFGEFMGTMVLVLLGNGVIADVALARSKAEGRMDRGVSGMGVRSHVGDFHSGGVWEQRHTH